MEETRDELVFAGQRVETPDRAPAWQLPGPLPSYIGENSWTRGVYQRVTS